MRDHLFINSVLTRLSAAFLLAFLLAGCSEGTPDTPATTTGGPTTPPPTLSPYRIALSSSTNSIPNDNATTATLTATVVDSSLQVMAGVYISFGTNTGSLYGFSGPTDEFGRATIKLISGDFDVTNRIATVTAQVGTLSATRAVVINGSNMTLNLTSNNVVVGSSPTYATAAIVDAGSHAVQGATVRFSIGASSTGGGTLSATTLVTGATGETTQVVFTPTTAGKVVLTAEWLDAGVVVQTVTQDITVGAAAGIPFAIVDPMSSPTAVSSGASQNLGVTVPDTIGVTAVASVRISSSSSGTWTGTNPAAGPAGAILQTPSSNAVAAIYTAANSSGTVTVQVEALDASGNQLGYIEHTFLVSAPSSASAKVYLSPVVSTLLPSTGTFTSKTDLQVIVRDAANNSVGGAAVNFGLLNTTGTGEYISPAIVITDSFGQAKTTLYAGSQPTLGAIFARASVAGQACTGSSTDPVNTETNPMCDAEPIIVASTAVSVSVGFGTKVVSTEKDTMYELPGSVNVVNANGSGVAGVPVTLTVFPVSYTNGVMYADDDTSAGGSVTVPQCVGPYADRSAEGTGNPGPAAVWAASEDVNRNTLNDSGEDVNGNGILSPPSAAGGAVPLTVTTDSTGVATFMLKYPKSSALFIVDELTARVQVNNTESLSRMYKLLPISLEDKFDPVCPLARWAAY